MSDAPAVVASPSSRARLVVASQGLEIQHLQEQLARKDREHHSAINAILEEKASVEANLAQQQGRCQRLETQVQLLGERLRELEAREDVLVTGDANMHAELSKANKARDEMLAQIREEVRALRIQNTSLMQERDVIAERLATEKRRVVQLEADSGSVPRAAPSPLTTRRQYAYNEPADASTQTADSTAFSSVEDVLMHVAKSETTPDAEVEALKKLLELELGLDAYHRNVAAQHAANAAIAQDALTQKVESEVMRLAAEQERFRSMIQATRGGTAAGQSTFFTPAPRYAAPPSNGMHQAQQQVPLSARAMMQSPISAPDVSPSTVFSGPSYTPQAAHAPALSNFVVQQHEELAALRSRLSQLQQRHEEVRGVKHWGTGTASSQVSPPRPDFGSSGYGRVPVTTHRAESPQPDELTAAAYRSFPTPTPLVSPGAAVSSLVTPPPPVGRSLNKAVAAQETSRLAAPSTVLDRMLRKSAAAAQH